MQKQKRLMPQGSYVRNCQTLVSTTHSLVRTIFSLLKSQLLQVTTRWRVRFP